MIISDETIVYDGALQPFMFRAATGDLLIVGYSLMTAELWEAHYQRNRYPGFPHWLVSHDDGASWEEIELPRAALTQGMVVSGLELPNGDFLLYEIYAYRDEPGDGPYTGQLWIARDGFRQIEGPIDTRVDLPAISNADDGGHPVDIVITHRGLLQLPGGELIATAYCRFPGDDAPSEYRPTMRKTRVVLLESHDTGRSWTYRATIAVDPAVGQEGFNETGMARTPDGRLVCHMRTGSAGCPVYQASSEDDGHTWSTPRPLPFAGVNPDLTCLRDGTLVSNVGTRLWDNSGRQLEDSGMTPTHKLAFSRDGGETWPDILELPRSRSTTYYTSLVELPDGSLLVAYDNGCFGETDLQLAIRRITR